LGTTLLTRGRTGVALTPYGQMFLQSAKTVVSELDDACGRLEALKKGDRGHVRIGGVQIGTSRAIPLAISRLKAVKPAITVSLFTGQHEHLLSALKAGQLDLVFGHRGDASQMVGLTYEALFDERLTLVVRPDHPLAKTTAHQLQDLVELPWIVPLPSVPTRMQLDALLARSKIPFPRDYVESVFGPATLVYIEHTSAIGAIPDKIFDAELKAGRIKRLMTLDVDVGQVGITRKEAIALSPATRLMVQELRRIGTMFRT
jgi:LysR family pca operon transcriptional activator